MNVAEYFVSTLKSNMSIRILNETLDKQHPNSDPAEDATFRKILSAMPLESTCGDECKSAIDACAAFCRHIQAAFGNDLPRLYETAIYSCARVLSCYIDG